MSMLYILLSINGASQMRKAKELRHPQDAFISMLVTIWKALPCLDQKDMRSMMATLNRIEQRLTENGWMD